jgi:hypothetical protein
MLCGLMRDEHNPPANFAEWQSAAVKLNIKLARRLLAAALGAASVLAAKRINRRLAFTHSGGTR